MRWKQELSMISDRAPWFRYGPSGLAMSLGIAAVLWASGGGPSRHAGSGEPGDAGRDRCANRELVDGGQGIGRAVAVGGHGHRRLRERTRRREFDKVVASERLVRVEEADGAAVIFELVDEGRSLEIRYEGEAVGDVRVLDDALAVTAAEEGYAVVPCREGLLIPATSGVAFSQTFGTSDYEGCHMNMIGLVKRGSRAGGKLGRRLRVRRAEEHAAGRTATARSDSRPASTCGARHARFVSRRWAKATGTRWPPATAASPTRRAWP